MTDFRRGDVISVELTVKQEPHERPHVAHIIGSDMLAKLDADGKVTLVRRAEPDWRPGDIGQHIETGNLWALLSRIDGELEWRRLVGSNDLWLSREQLAGKLVRCTVTPDQPPPTADEWHQHTCRSGQVTTATGHPWMHRQHPGRCHLPHYTACPDHSVTPEGTL